MNRRKFIRNMISTSILSLGGVSAYQYYQQTLLTPAQNNDFNYQFLNEQDRILIEVLIPVFIADMPFQKPIQSALVANNIDSAITLLPERIQEELRELFNLLGSAFGRLVFANVWLNWQSASLQTIDKFLVDWRESSFDLLQIAYKGLHKIIIGSIYSEESTWSAIGYSGPPLLAGTKL